jgi:hypothetical protein
MDMLEGQYQNPVRILRFNTAEKWFEDGPAMLPTRCVGGVIFSSATCRSTWIATRRSQISSCPCRCVWCEPWRSSARSPRRSAPRRRFPGFVEPATRSGLHQAAIAGPPRSSSTATAVRSTSPTPRSRYSPGVAAWTNHLKKLASDDLAYHGAGRARSVAGMGRETGEQHIYNPAHFHDAVMQLSPEQRHDRAIVTDR